MTGSAVEHSRDRPVLLYVVSILLIASTVSWRRGTYFSGSLDPVVLLKAMTSAAALALAMLSLSRTREPTPLGPRTVAFLTAFLVVTCLGGWAAHTAVASVVLAVRVAVLAGAMICVLQAYTAEMVLNVMVRVMAATAALGAVSSFAPGLGASSGGYATNLGRLAGGIPPLSPNGLAFLGGMVVLASVWRVVEGKGKRWDWMAIAGFVGVVWLTGSRTCLASLAVAVILVVLQARTITTRMFLGLVALLPASFYLLFATSTVSNVFSRGGNQNMATLSSRTVAWDAALQFNVSLWQQWFGGGLAMKQVPVAGQYWTQQILDSSWISALVQGGLVGLALAGLWVCAAILASLFCDRRWRSLWLGLLMFLVSRSFLESGLFDATPDFLIFIMISVMSEKASRTHVPTGAPAAPMPADRVGLSA